MVLFIFKEIETMENKSTMQNMVDMLMSQMARLNDTTYLAKNDDNDDITLDKDRVALECERAQAMIGLSEAIVSTGRLVLDTEKTKRTYRVKDGDMPLMLDGSV